METNELQNLLNYNNSFPNVMENLHKPLLDAIENKNFRNFKQIIEENLKKHPAIALTIVKYVNPNTGDTYLDIVSREGLIEFVEFLLCKGAEINRVNEMYNCAPIHFAAKSGHVDTLKILLAQPTINVDLEVEQQSALHIAVENDNLKCADLLLEKGANINILNNKNLTALHLAVMKNQRDMVKMMLDKYMHRLQIDRYKDYNGQTTREIIKQKLPELKEELAQKLPFKNENWEVNMQDLKYYLNNRDETNFLKCMEIVQGEISSDIAENLLTKSIQYNFQQAVIAILNKFKGKHFNVRKSIREAIQNGHYDILNELLKVEPLINDLLLSVCQELGMPDKQGNDNLLKCLELILEQNNVNVRSTDKKGNTPLHYAARADNCKAMSLLLKQGSYIGHMNKFNVPPIVDIPMCTLLNYFNDCLKMIKDQTNKYVIEFDYRCLMPHVFTKQDTTQQPTRETEIFLYIARNKSLKHLLKHPLLSSFLYLKWLKIRHVLYANFIFYGTFCVLLNAYILSMTYESLPKEKKTQIVNNGLDIVYENILYYPDVSFLQISVIILWLVFTLREIFQCACCPCRYVMDWVNWLQIMLIIFIVIFLYDVSIWSGVMVIILSALVLVVLIGQHPKMSASFEMFQTVSLNYVYLLFPYIFLIVAFALAFHTLFKNNANFSGLGFSLFKTIIMITGEFNSNDIPFDSYPVWSHVVFLLFVFLIAIVLFNLLNGLAVSDTNKILSKAELFGLISRIRLIIYLEDIAFGEPFNWFNCENSRFLRWKPFAFLINRILLFPHYLKNNKITVIYDNLDAYNDKYYVHSNSINRVEHWPILEMDPNIIKQAKRIIFDKNQLSDNEKILIALKKQEEKLIAMEIALRKLNPI
ncbi:transient receptor potential cation channel protein painless [Solenopsis invicta]|uniref:transient receptor potential cation channel protein painless n=1 Tax=Solenopsis invicta TaxID=13686 RepID=UPI000595DA15|nr:transient receptor potential cation channel protein painless [Solenopsis invicta]